MQPLVPPRDIDDQHPQSGGHQRARQIPCQGALAVPTVILGQCNARRALTVLVMVVIGAELIVHQCIQSRCYGYLPLLQSVSVSSKLINTREQSILLSPATAMLDLRRGVNTPQWSVLEDHKDVEKSLADSSPVCRCVGASATFHEHLRENQVIQDNSWRSLVIGSGFLRLL